MFHDDGERLLPCRSLSSRPFQPCMRSFVTLMFPPTNQGPRDLLGSLLIALHHTHTLHRRVSPAYHIYGHVHEGFGMWTDEVTTYVNASTCTHQYKPCNRAIVFDLPPKAQREGALRYGVCVLSCLHRMSLFLPCWGFAPGV